MNPVFCLSLSSHPTVTPLQQCHSHRVELGPASLLPTLPALSRNHKKSTTSTIQLFSPSSSSTLWLQLAKHSSQWRPTWSKSPSCSTQPSIPHSTEKVRPPPRPPPPRPCKLINKRAAELALKQEAAKPQYSLSLLTIVSNESAPANTRLAASLAFKNFIRTNYVVRLVPRADPIPAHAHSSSRTRKATTKSRIPRSRPSRSALSVS